MLRCYHSPDKYPAGVLRSKQHSLRCCPFVRCAAVCAFTVNTHGPATSLHSSNPWKTESGSPRQPTPYVDSPFHHNNEGPLSDHATIFFPLKKVKPSFCRPSTQISSLRRFAVLNAQINQRSNTRLLRRELSTKISCLSRLEGAWRWPLGSAEGGRNHVPLLRVFHTLTPFQGRASRCLFILHFIDHVQTRLLPSARFGLFPLPRSGAGWGGDIHQMSEKSALNPRKALKSIGLHREIRRKFRNLPATTYLSNCSVV